MRKTGIPALLLALCMLLSACGAKTQLERTEEYLKTAVPEPDFGSLNGDWIVFGLARAGADLSENYFERYYNAVEAAVQAADGMLDENRYTEYSRLILALTAVGRWTAAAMRSRRIPQSPCRRPAMAMSTRSLPGRTRAAAGVSAAARRIPT